MFRWFKTPRLTRTVSRRARPILEACEPRNLLTGPVLITAARQLFIEGSQAGDQVRITSSNNQLVVTFNGGGGLFNSAGIDRILFVGQGGNDLFVNNSNIRCIATGDSGNDTLIGGGGKDWLDGGSGFDGINGAGNDDLLRGGDHNDSIAGGSGHDLIEGGSFNDRLFGSDGDDWLDGGGGNDWLEGGSGHDRQDGNMGHDSVLGGDGNDDLRGNFGDDGLNGGNGDDLLSGGPGRDFMDGGFGDDRAFRDRDDNTRGCEGFEFVAILTGTPGAFGRSEFKPGTNVRRNFELEVFGLTPNQTLDVQLDGVTIGQIRVGAFGVGELKFNNPTLPVHQGSILAVKNGLGANVLVGTYTNTEGDEDDHDGGGDDDDNLARVEGTLTAKTATTVTITRLSGSSVTVSVNGSTNIERNDIHTTLAGLRIGDRAEARYDPTTLLATKVESVGP